MLINPRFHSLTFFLPTTHICVENYRLRVFGAMWAQNKDPEFYRFWNAWEIVRQPFETIFPVFFGKLLLETQFFC